MITWDEFVSKPEPLGDEYEPTDIACPKCGKALWKNVKIELRCNPGMHYYMCLNWDCGWVGTH